MQDGSKKHTQRSATASERENKFELIGGLNWGGEKDKSAVRKELEEKEEAQRDEKREREREQELRQRELEKKDRNDMEANRSGRNLNFPPCFDKKQHVFDRANARIQGETIANSKRQVHTIDTKGRYDHNS